MQKQETSFPQEEQKNKVRKGKYSDPIYLGERNHPLNADGFLLSSIQ